MVLPDVTIALPEADRRSKLLSCSLRRTLKADIGAPDPLLIGIASQILSQKCTQQLSVLKTFSVPTQISAICTPLITRSRSCYLNYRVAQFCSDSNCTNSRVRARQQRKPLQAHYQRTRAEIISIRHTPKG